MIIERRVAPKTRAVPRRRASRRRLLTIVGFAALFLLALAAAAHDAIEKTFVEHALASALDADVTVGALRHEAGLTILEPFALRTKSGMLALTAERASYARTGTTLDVRLTGAKIGVALATVHGDEPARLRDLARTGGADALTLRLQNAAATVRRVPDTEANVEIAGLTGSATFGAAAPRWDLRFDVVDASGAYPVRAHGTRVEAETLPVAPFAGLVQNDAFRARDGLAHGVQIDLGAHPAAALTLAGVELNVAGTAVHGLAGPLAFTSDGAGSAALDATLDGGVPLAASGEVHDVGDWPTALTAGTPDLRRVARLLATIAGQPQLQWVNLETTAPGIAFGQYAMTTKAVPHVVQLLLIDPAEPTLRFDAALSSEHVISKGERTSDLALRTNAVAGINGDYFDIGHTYEPQGLLIMHGKLIHGPTHHASVAIDAHNKATIGIFHLTGSAESGGRRYPITLFNSWPTHETAVITPDYGTTLPAAPNDTFVALEPIADNRYRVTSVTRANAPLPVSFGIGIGDQLGVPPPRVGEVVTLDYHVDVPPGTVAAVSCGPILLKDGVWFEDKRAPAPDERDVQWPVDAFGTMRDGTIVLAAVDGRHPERSVGMSRPEFGELLRRLGVVDAMAFDSGGSVTLVARSPGNSAITVHNVPSDNSAERYITDALLVYSGAKPGTIVTKPRPHVEPTGPAQPASRP